MLTRLLDGIYPEVEITEVGSRSEARGGFACTAWRLCGDVSFSQAAEGQQNHVARRESKNSPSSRVPDSSLEDVMEKEAGRVAPTSIVDGRANQYFQNRITMR